MAQFEGIFFLIKITPARGERGRSEQVVIHMENSTQEQSGKYDYWERRCETDDQKRVILAIVDIDTRNGGEPIIIQDLSASLDLGPKELSQALLGLKRLGLIRDCIMFNGCPCIFTLDR